MAGLTVQQVEELFIKQGLTPERLGEGEFARLVHEEVNRTASTRNPAVSKSGSRRPTASGMRSLGDTFSPEWMAATREALRKHRRPDVQDVVEQDVCGACDGARFVRVTADPDHPLFGDYVPCSECSTGFTAEERVARAGIPKRYERMRFGVFDRRVNPDAYDVLESWDGLTNLVIDGGPGRGKTHLAVAALHRELEERGRVGAFVYVPMMLDEVRRRYGDESSEDAQTYIDRLVKWPVLLLDDIGAERVTPWVTEQLVSLIDRRLQADVVTVVTTNLTSLEAISKHYTARDSDGIAGDRLASRLGAAVFQWVRASGPDMRQYAVQMVGAR